MKLTLIAALLFSACATTRSHIPTRCCPEKRWKQDCAFYYRAVSDPRSLEKHECVEVTEREMQR
jgi:hypothetical protein